MKRSLTRQIVSIVGILVAGAIVMCWILNSTLLQNYYIMNKKRAMTEAYETILNASEKDVLESTAFDVTFDRICSNGNLTILVMQPDYTVIRSSTNDIQVIVKKFQGIIFRRDDDDEISIRSEILQEGDNYWLLRNTDTRLDSEYLVLVGSLENGDVVFVQTALESIRESAMISNKFLLMIGSMAIAASLIVGFFVTRRITMPILQLTEISERMVELDFNAKYVRGEWRKSPRASVKNLFNRTQLAVQPKNRVPGNEIDQLGDHINRLSSQLEKTISELKSANVELQKDIEKKTQIDEMRKEFLSNVSHELKTPLALIQGYAEGLQECINDDAESREFYCEVIIDEAEKMNQMVKKLLTLNQLEFGNEQISMERFDMTELIRGVANSTRILMEQKGIRLDMSRMDSSVYVWGDEFKVEEVITNYMSNAINHAEGERIIRISCAHVEDRLRVSVFNTGQPIPEADIDQIWVKFYKVDKARTREYGGSGIGLSIVKAIMDSFGQECGVINHPDGVEFWMELSAG